MTTYQRKLYGCQLHGIKVELIWSPGLRLTIVDRSCRQAHGRSKGAPYIAVRRQPRAENPGVASGRASFPAPMRRPAHQGSRPLLPAFTTRRFAYRATTSISTDAPKGSAATAIVVRAG